MQKTHLPFRQVHLDFHTSEYCEDIGADFSEEQFAEALRAGRVQCINIFAKCHHGWSYYPNPTLGNAHPHLKTDLVGGMLNACRKAGVHCSVYISTGRDEYAARRHPEWCVCTPDGNQSGASIAHPDTPKPAGHWMQLCMNTDYVQEIITETRDIMERYNPPGMWYDITVQHPCVCKKCRADMAARGMNPDNPDDQRKFAKIVHAKFLKTISDVIWSYNPETTVFHNGAALRGRYDLYDSVSHFEIESLPTGGWGYDHFPPNARYFTMLPKQVVGMTGKFHKSWGEFGGYKNPVALRYECAQIVSLGCLVSTGDQLHPSGKMDMETYRIIGEAYEYVESREPWLKDARPLAKVAILATMDMMQSIHPEPYNAISGAGKILMEAHIPHVIIDETMDFSPYKMLILPDYVRLEPGVRDKLKRFVAGGGKLLMTYQSGIAADSWSFALDAGGVCTGPSENDVEYLEVTDRTAANMVRNPILLYKSGINMAPDGSGTVLAYKWKPAFNRTWGRFTSHRNTPYERRMDEPEAILKDNIIYISSPFFQMYDIEGMQLHRDFIVNCINILYPYRMIKTNLPSCGRVAVARQQTENGGARDIIHVMYAAPVKRGNVEVIEDIVPLHNVKVAYRTERQPRKVYLAPEGNEIIYTYVNNSVEFTLPVLNMAQIVVVEY